jgi:hypothetical protein
MVYVIFMLTETLTDELTQPRGRQSLSVKGMRRTKSSLTNHTVQNTCIILISLFGIVNQQAKKVVKTGKCGRVSNIPIMQVIPAMLEKTMPNMEVSQKSGMFGVQETHSDKPFMD